MSAPCVTCPWRKSSTVGGRDIPGFSIEKMRGLRNTVGEGDAFRTIMACHGSEEGADRACDGYRQVEGYSNLAVRMGMIDGRYDLTPTPDIEMWGSFEEMLDAYEEAQ